jgi:hypothetical protein
MIGGYHEDSQKNLHAAPELIHIIVPEIHT